MLLLVNSCTVTTTSRWLNKANSRRHRWAPASAQPAEFGWRSPTGNRPAPVGTQDWTTRSWSLRRWCELRHFLPCLPPPWWHKQPGAWQTVKNVPLKLAQQQTTKGCPIPERETSSQRGRSAGWPFTERTWMAKCHYQSEEVWTLEPFQRQQLWNVWERGRGTFGLFHVHRKREIPSSPELREILSLIYLSKRKSVPAGSYFR